MYLGLQFPLADSRSFLPQSHTGRLNVPEWPDPAPNVEFMRYFGSIRLRPQGGASGAIGNQRVFCRARRAVRFCENLTTINAASQQPMNFRPDRRFSSDGDVVGAFTVSVTEIQPFERWLPLRLDQNGLATLIERFLTQQVSIPAPQQDSGKVRKALHLAGAPLAWLYLTSSTLSNQIPTVEKWWVRTGTPLLFLKYNQRFEHLDSPYPLTEVALPEESGGHLSFCLVPVQGGHLPMWILGLDAGTIDLNQTRDLRLSLLRLHAQHECLRLVLNHINSRRIQVTPRSDQAQMLQRYLRDATTALRRLEKTVKIHFAPSIADIARNALKTLLPNEHVRILDRLAEIVASLQELDVRPSVVQNVSNVYVGGDYFEHVGDNAQVFTGEVQMGSKQSGDGMKGN